MGLSVSSKGTTGTDLINFGSDARSYRPVALEGLQPQRTLCWRPSRYQVAAAVKSIKTFRSFRCFQCVSSVFPVCFQCVSSVFPVCFQLSTWPLRSLIWKILGLWAATNSRCGALEQCRDLSPNCMDLKDPLVKCHCKLSFDIAMAMDYSKSPFAGFVFVLG